MNIESQYKGGISKPIWQTFLKNEGSSYLLTLSIFYQKNGWYPELVFLIVVLVNSTILTQVFPNSSVLWKVFL